VLEPWSSPYLLFTHCIFSVKVDDKQNRHLVLPHGAQGLVGTDIY
jgi:hypothetical protein